MVLLQNTFPSSMPLRNAYGDKKMVGMSGLSLFMKAAVI
jgi:hypothetical protein